MNKVKNGVARRRRVKPLAKLAVKLVSELVVGTLLLVALVAIEGGGHLAVAWLVERVGSRWLTDVVAVVEALVVLVDAVCYLWVVVVSVWSFIKEVH